MPLIDRSTKNELVVFGFVFLDFMNFVLAGRLEFLSREFSQSDVKLEFLFLKAASVIH